MNFNMDVFYNETFRLVFILIGILLGACIGALYSSSDMKDRRGRISGVVIGVLLYYFLIIFIPKM
jgi:hypothetical protein